MFASSVNFSANETTITEAKEQFDFIIEQLTNFIENGELDKLTFNKRNEINEMFDSISAQLNQLHFYKFNLSSVPNIGNNIFSYILSLRDQLDTVLFYTKGKGFADYLNESKELINIKKDIKN